MQLNEYEAPTRHGDPETSFEAAATISGEKMTQAMLHVLYVLEAYSPFPLIDEELCVHYDALGKMRQTHQSIRSRRAQLVRLGYVEQTGHALNNHGNRCRCWAITAKGLERVNEELGLR